jgi:hypothetical protein
MRPVDHPPVSRMAVDFEMDFSVELLKGFLPGIEARHYLFFLHLFGSVW